MLWSIYKWGRTTRYYCSRSHSQSVVELVLGPGPSNNTAWVLYSPCPIARLFNITKVTYLKYFWSKGLSNKTLHISRIWLSKWRPRLLSHSASLVVLALVLGSFIWLTTLLSTVNYSSFTRVIPVTYGKLSEEHTLAGHASRGVLNIYISP